ncbi:nucleoside triphosphate pyrophosphatase [Persicitalea sp.]|uniref:Maf family protein n=1 Tax=Persicitalea sp. TaxID=3100273 RepID=UPI0035939E28
MRIPLSRPLILASNSPRRQQLLAQCGFEFSIEARPTDEVFPTTMPPDEVPAYLAQKKAEQFQYAAKDSIILCADTIVVKDDLILNKPADETAASEMLQRLSGTTHRVVTGVCLLDGNNMTTQTDIATVTLREFSRSELDFYVKYQPPFDKAGGYGIQDWIGLIGIERIEGSYYTIMGLPTHLVYDMLRPYFIE